MALNTTSKALLVLSALVALAAVFWPSGGPSGAAPGTGDGNGYGSSTAGVEEKCPLGFTGPNPHSFATSKKRVRAGLPTSFLWLG